MQEYQQPTDLGDNQIANDQSQIEIQGKGVFLKESNQESQHMQLEKLSTDLEGDICYSNAFKLKLGLVCLY